MIIKTDGCNYINLDNVDKIIVRPENKAYAAVFQKYSSSKEDATTLGTMTFDSKEAADKFIMEKCNHETMK